MKFSWSGRIFLSLEFHVGRGVPAVRVIIRFGFRIDCKEQDGPFIKGAAGLDTVRMIRFLKKTLYIIGLK